MFTSVVPVSVPIFLGFFLIPFVVAVAVQTVLCLFVTNKAAKLSLVFVSVLLGLLVLLCRFTDFLAFLIGGFVALLLLFTALVILTGALLGWLISLVVRAGWKKE